MKINSVRFRSWTVCVAYLMFGQWGRMVKAQVLFFGSLEQFVNSTALNTVNCIPNLGIFTIQTENEGRPGAQ